MLSSCNCFHKIYDRDKPDSQSGFEAGILSTKFIKFLSNDFSFQRFSENLFQSEAPSEDVDSAEFVESSFVKPEILALCQIKSCIVIMFMRYY